MNWLLRWFSSKRVATVPAVGIRLAEAMLCEDCKSLTAAKKSYCLRCGSTAVWPIASVLEEWQVKKVLEQFEVRCGVVR